jgi:hypothetical protein
MKTFIKYSLFAVLAMSLSVGLLAGQAGQPVVAKVPAGGIPNGAIPGLGNTTDARCTLTDATAEGVVCLLKELSFLLQNSLATTTVDGGNASLGAKGDAKSAATDTTAINAIQILKEISFLLQNALTVNLPTGASTASNQTTGNGALATLVTNTTPLATATVKAASTPPAASDPSLVVAVSPNSYTSSCVDRSGSITTGGTAQTAAALNASRKDITIFNYPDATTQGISTAENLFVSFTGTATESAGVPAAGVVVLAPGKSLNFGAGTVSTQAVSVNAATTGHKWYACEQ